jgi:hypothetical protein
MLQCGLRILLLVFCYSQEFYNLLRDNVAPDSLSKCYNVAVWLMYMLPLLLLYLQEFYNLLRDNVAPDSLSMYDDRLQNNMAAMAV